MAAKIYSNSIEKPRISWANPKAWKESEERYIQKTKELLLKRKKGKNVGEIISFPYADSNAQYMVASMRPLELVHLEVGDAWEFPQAHLMTAKEVQKKLDSQKRIEELFSK